MSPGVVAMLEGEPLLRALPLLSQRRLTHLLRVHSLHCRPPRPAQPSAYRSRTTRQANCARGGGIYSKREPIA
eukprot:6813021-Pyramimonas_sp.AAC.1